MKFILGKKIEMSQIFSDNKRIPVTKIKAGPCVVTQVKSEDKPDGYNAVQVGFEEKNKNVNKPQKDKQFEYLKEFRLEKQPDFEKGDTITVENFKKGDKLKVKGTSKGKGFQGSMKRHGFSGFPKTHGHKKGGVRSRGSIGTIDPERVFPGTKMPGRTGGNTTTIPNLELVKVDPENHILFIKGSVPGSRGNLLKIQAN